MHQSRFQNCHPIALTETKTSKNPAITAFQGRLRVNQLNLTALRNVFEISDRTLSLCAAFMIWTCLMGSAIAEEDSQPSKNPSILVPKENGVLWFQKGDDRNTPLALALGQSLKEPYFVIFVSTTDEYEEKAIPHALKLAKWFEDTPQAPKKIAVVAYKSTRATYFVYYINGLHYAHKTDAPDGIMGPQESFKLREDAVLTYRASMIIKDQEDVGSEN